MSPQLNLLSDALATVFVVTCRYNEITQTTGVMAVARRRDGCVIRSAGRQCKTWEEAEFVPMAAHYALAEWLYGDAEDAVKVFASYFDQQRKALNARLHGAEKPHK